MSVWAGVVQADVLHWRGLCGFGFGGCGFTAGALLALLSTPHPDQAEISWHLSQFYFLVEKRWTEPPPRRLHPRTIFSCTLFPRWAMPTADQATSLEGGANTAECALCPVRCGAFKRSREDGRWVHMVCAHHHPEVTIEQGERAAIWWGLLCRCILLNGPSSFRNSRTVHEQTALLGCRQAHDKPIHVPTQRAFFPCPLSCSFSLSVMMPSDTWPDHN